MANIIKGLLPSGKAPSVLKEEIIGLIKTEAPAPDLTPYAKADALQALDTRVDDLEGKPAAGIYIDAYGRTRQYIFVASDTDPGKTRLIDGIEYEVWWVQTTPPDPTQYVPAKVAFDAAARSYTVPSDAGASYKIDGVLRPAGVYPVAGMAEVKVTWEATPKPGFTFKQGAVTSGSFTFPVKTFVSGDVMMSDSFERADGPIGGSTSDSFAGGIPYVWKSTGGVPGMIKSGALTTSPEMVAGKQTFVDYDLPAAQQAIALEWVPIAVAGATATYMIVIYTTDGRLQINGQGGVSSFPTGADGLTVSGSVNPVVGDVLRLVYDGSTVQVRNTRTGEVAAYVGGDSSRLRLTGKVTSIRIDIRHEFSSLGQIKVAIP